MNKVLLLSLLVFLGLSQGISAQKELSQEVIVLRNKSDLMPLSDLGKLKVATFSSEHNQQQQKGFNEMKMYI